MVKEIKKIDREKLFNIPDECEDLKEGDVAVVTFWEGCFSTFLMDIKKIDDNELGNSSKGISYSLSLAFHAISKESYDREFNKD